MADNNDALTTALGSLTTQLQQLNQYYQEQTSQLNDMANLSPSYTAQAASTYAGQMTLATANVSAPSIATSFSQQIPSPAAQNAGQVSTSASVASTPQGQAQQNQSNEQLVNAKILSEYGGPLGKLTSGYQLGLSSTTQQIAATSSALNQIGGVFNSNQNSDGSQMEDENGNPMASGALSSLPGANLLSSGAQAASSFITNTLGGNNTKTTFLASAAVSNLGSMVGHIDGIGNTEQTIGNSLGYGSAQNVAGHHIPLYSDFTQGQQEGATFNAVQQELTGTHYNNLLGSSLSSAQAQSIGDVLGNQGFSNQLGGRFGTADNPQGDEATLATQFMNPVMSASPGVSATSLGEYTPIVRNAQTSVEQLTASFSDLNTQAQTTKEGVNQLTENFAQAASTFSQLGSSDAGSYATAKGFTGATGLDPQVASQLAQNPLIQGMALSQGILPSAIGDMGGGEFSSLTEKSLGMFNNMLKGDFHNKYNTTDGIKTLALSASTQRYDQLASMTGMKESTIRRMLGDKGQITDAAKMENILGSSTGNGGEGDGMYALLNKGLSQKGGLNGTQNATMKYDWQGLEQEMRKGGVSSKDLKQLNSVGTGTTTGWKTRLEESQKDIDNLQKKDPYNKIDKGPTKQTVAVHIDLTPYAKKLFKVSDISTNKKSANSGGPQSINAYVNSVQGDLTNTELQQGLPKAFDQERQAVTRAYNKRENPVGVAQQEGW